MSKAIAKSLPIRAVAETQPGAVRDGSAGSASSAPGDVDLDRRVRAALERIRPAVQADGGDVEIVDIHAGVVRVRFKGACVGCPSSNLTLHMGIERAIRDEAPEIARVEAV